MTDNVEDLSNKNFTDSIKKGRWIVDFWAPWCGPCKAMTPHFEAAAKEKKGEVKFGKINVDENFEIANQFEVMSIPTVILFENGEVIHASVGSMNKEQILETIKNIFE
jgi:thioredoxin 1